MSEESRFVRWWKANPERAEEIKKRRRDAYSDPLAKEVAAVKRAEYKRRRQARGKTPRKPKLFPFRGKMIELWAVGAVADSLQINKRTLGLMEAQGRIPLNHLLDESGHRWWPAAFVDWLKPFFELRRTRQISTQEFLHRVSEGWQHEIKRGVIPVLEEHRDRAEAGLSEAQGSDDLADFPDF